MDLVKTLGLDGVDAVIDAEPASELASPSDSAAPDGQSLARMGVRIGSLGLLFPVEAGREVMPPPPVSRVPNTVSWLRGLANVRGGLVPVVDSCAAFGVRRDAGAPYLQIFGRGESAMGLLIDGLPRLFSVEISHRLTELPAVPALLEGSVLAAYDHDHQLWMDVDIQSLLDTFARHTAL
jgi:chemotaxis signal transduction protein